MILTSSSARANLRTAKARTPRSVKPGPSSSRASSMPTSCPQRGSSFSTACFASTGSDQVTHLRNLVRERGERNSENLNFHRRSLSSAESDAVGGNRKISYKESKIPLGIPLATYVQTVTISWSRLKIFALIAQALTAEKLPMLDLHWILPPGFRIVRPPQVGIGGKQVGWKSGYVLVDLGWRREQWLWGKAYKAFLCIVGPLSYGNT